jgi:ATP-dependent Clp protease protease subunit
MANTDEDQLLTTMMERGRLHIDEVRDAENCRHPLITSYAAAGTPELWIYGIIGGPASAGGVAAKDVLKAMDGLKRKDELTVRINSEGGIVGEGLGIYNALKRFPGRVIVEVDGIALSAASFIAMAGHEIRMAENSLMMIHDAWDVVAGNAKELRQKAEQLDRWNSSIIAIYEGRTGIERDRIVAMMAKETWMEPEEAKALGFATSIAAPQRVAAKFDPARFKNVPAAALRRIGIERPLRQRCAIETETFRQALEAADRRRVKA